LDGGSALPQGSYVHRTTQAQKKHGHTDMHRVGFEQIIPVLERAKAVHALRRAANVIGGSRFILASF
jgi:hypothetical protein